MKRALAHVLPALALLAVLATVSPFRASSAPDAVRADQLPQVASMLPL